MVAALLATAAIGCGAGEGSDMGPAPADTGIWAEPPFEPEGDPIDAPDGEWTWIPFPDTSCRDGSEAGIGVNMSSSSSNVMIFLEGGGACFTPGTCAENPESVERQAPAGNGVFARDNAENPVADWNYVYVPYCTGDVHIGAQPDGTIEGVSGEQQFVGRLNLEKFLHRLVPTFSDADQVLFTGVSAGGFGAASNGIFMQWAFGDIPVTVIDDSGPIFSEEYLPSCISEIYRTTWNLDETILADCGEACSEDGPWSTQALEYSATNMGMASGNFGIISSTSDFIIRGFYGIATNNGADDCMGTLLLTSMAEERFQNGLLDLRMRVEGYEGFSTYYIPGVGHTILSGDGFYSEGVEGVALTDWFQGVLSGAEDSHIGGV